MTLSSITARSSKTYVIDVLTLRLYSCQLALNKGSNKSRSRGTLWLVFCPLQGNSETLTAWTFNPLDESLKISQQATSNGHHAFCKLAVWIMSRSYVLFLGADTSETASRIEKAFQVVSNKNEGRFSIDVFDADCAVLEGRLYKTFCLA